MVDKVDTHIDPPPSEKDPSPAEAAVIAAQAKNGVTRVNAPTEMDLSQIPEKFKGNLAEFTKAYLELERKQSQGNQVVPPTDPKKATGETTTNPAQKGLDALKLPAADQAKAAEQVVANAGLNIAEFQTEFSQKGELSPESYAKLEKGGIPKAVVDQHIVAMAALQEKTFNDLYSIAGGQDQFDAMWEWSKASLPADEIDAINQAIDSNNPVLVKQAFRNVHTKWTSGGHAGEPAQIHTNRSGTGDVDTYTHRDELMKDMMNPEYKTNEAFRNRVAAKVKRSRVI